MCQFTCRIKSQWPNRQAQEGMPSQSSKHYQTALHRGRTRSHPLSTHQTIRLPLEGEKSFLFCSLSFEAKGSASRRPFSSAAASCPVRPPPTTPRMADPRTHPTHPGPPRGYTGASQGRVLQKQETRSPPGLPPQRLKLFSYLPSAPLPRALSDSCLSR